MLQHRLTVLSLLLTASVFLPACEDKMAKTAPEWEELTLPPKDPRFAFSVHTIHGTSATDIWVGASRYNLHFDGRQFVPVQNQAGRERAWRSVWAVGPADVWAVGAHGSVAHFDGTAWREQKLDQVDYDLLYVIAWPNQVIVTAGGSELHRFDGKTWRQERPAELANASLHRLFGLSPNNLYVQVTKGKNGPPVVAHFDGTTWKLETLGERAGTVYALHGSAPDDVWAAGKVNKTFGDGGQLLHFDGKTWSQAELPIDEPLFDVYATSKTQAWACGKNGVILRWDGRQWTRSASGTKQGLGALFAPPGVKPMVATNDAVLRLK
ncbi:MAG TPA: hypothetical protein PKI03_05545 [Pseudomonadota bacterium]|jgi:photosystem II stability/assembly factor-like uncharacterized protein|nr:hypothetical protein [Pseudomonadota bacterium]